MRSTVVSVPMRSKFSASHLSARSRPSSKRYVKNLHSAFILLEPAIHADLAACNAYETGAAAAANVACATTLILGERDQMTPLASGRSLAALIENARTIVLPGAGHMSMIERPDEVLEALKASVACARL